MNTFRLWKVFPPIQSAHLDRAVTDTICVMDPEDAQENDPATMYLGNPHSPSGKAISQCQNVTNNGDKSGRKSLGRRVSFAATARVRLYEKEETTPSQSPAPPTEETDSDDESPALQPSASFDPVESLTIRPKFTIWKPMQSHKEEDDMAITACIGGIIATEAPCLSTPNGNDPDGMELTECVGGFLVSTQPEPSTIKPTDSSPMELTEPLGHILSNISRDTLDVADIESQDMQLTACIGEILSDGATTVTDNLDTDPVLANDLAAIVDANEDIIKNVSDTIVSDVAPAFPTEHVKDPGSASFEIVVDDEIHFTLSSAHVPDVSQEQPFVSDDKSPPDPLPLPPTLSESMQSGPTSPVWQASLSPTPRNSASFIPNVTPVYRSSIGTPKWAPYTAPIHASIAQLSGGRKSRGSISAHQTPTTVGHSRYISDEHVSFITSMEQPRNFDLMDSPISSRHSPMVIHSPKHRRLTSPLVRTPSKLRPTSLFPSPKPKPSTALIATDTSTTDHINIATGLTLKEFLSVVGIRFLDHVSTSTRRETLARLYEERSSDFGFFLRDRLLMSICLHQPESQLYEQGCAVLEEKITETRAALDVMENKFPKSFFIPHKNDAVFSSEWISQLKALKTHARNQVQDQWYQWRRTHLVPLGELFQEHITKLQQDGAQLDQVRASMESVSNQLRSFHNLLLDRKRSIERDQSLIQQMDWKHYITIMQQKEKQDLHIQSIKDRIATIEKENNQCRSQLDGMAQTKDKLMDSLGQVHQDLDSMIDIDMSQVTWSKVQYDLVRSVTGVSINKLNSANGLLDLTCSFTPDFAKLDVRFKCHDNSMIFDSIKSISKVRSTPEFLFFTESVLPKMLFNVPWNKCIAIIYHELCLLQTLDAQLLEASLKFPIERVVPDLESISCDGYLVAQADLECSGSSSISMYAIRPHERPQNPAFKYQLLIKSGDEKICHHYDHIDQVLEHFVQLR